MPSDKGIRAGSAFVEIFGDDSPLVRVTKGIEARFKRMGRSVGNVGARVAGIGAAVTSIGAVGGAALAWPLQLAANMEKTEASFTTLLKSQAKANQLLGDLQRFAASTPLQFDEIADAAKKLLAFGTAAGDVEAELRRIGDISSAIGAPIGEIAEIYGKARVQGRLFAEDINQLTGRGIPVIQQLAKQFGVAENQLKGLVKDGKVGFANLEQAFKDLTKEGAQFSGGMEKQSKTLLGVISTLKDNIALAFRPFGQALLPAAKAVAEVATSIVQRFAAWAKANAGIARIVAGIVAGVITLGGVATAAGVALIGVGAAISAIGTIAGGVSAVVAAIGAPILGISAAVVAGLGAWAAGFGYVARQAGLIAPAFAFIRESFARIGAVFTQVFGGIVQAMRSGQFGKAAQIAWTGVQLAFLVGAQQVLKGLETLWNNAGTITARFLAALGTTVINTFKALPGLIYKAIRGGLAINEILRDTILSGLGGNLNLSARLDPAIQRTRQQLGQQIGSLPRGGVAGQVRSGPAFRPSPIGGGRGAVPADPRMLALMQRQTRLQQRLVTEGGLL